jgi:UDP-N-acetylglucosamine 1-carboxyvinyltransferase
MESIKITGGRPLKGEVTVSGAKNAATKELVACLLSKIPVTLTNVPRIGDVDVTIEMLKGLGVSVTQQDDRVTVDASKLSSSELTETFSKKNRIPILLFGPLLARFGTAIIPALGGCKIGTRPVDFHISALEQMGANIAIEDGMYRATIESSGRLHGAVIELEYPSVGATENVMLSAVLAKGTTVIRNAAIEPEIKDLAMLLQAMGAIIHQDVGQAWIIEGVDELHGAEHRVIPDRIEAASFAVASVLTKGDVLIRGAMQEHMISFLNALHRVGGDFEMTSEGIRVFRTGDIKPTTIETDVYPGFATDWQQPFLILLTQASGVSIVHETVYENRFGYTEALNRMGANITIHTNCLGSKPCRYSYRNHPHSAVIVGPTALKASNIEIPDLRAGFSYLVAALIAEGTSTITGVDTINRGYERIVEKLKGLGAEIEEG